MKKGVRRSGYAWAMMAALCWLCAASTARADNCTAQQRASLIQELKKEPTTWRESVKVTCDLTLSSSDVIKKVIQFAGAGASNLTLDCNGAQVGRTKDGNNYPINYNIPMIVVMPSKQADGTWSRPTNIKIRECNVLGTVQIKGASGIDDKQANYTKLMRDASPRGVEMDQMRITVAPEQPAPGGYTTERIGLYVFPGATQVTLKNSTIAGSTRLAVYLDAETAYNTFRNVQFRASSRREQVAIDGSSHNTFVSNYFGALSDGGVYLYRNCGEAGKIRHATPSYNQFINNVFYYDNYEGSNPAIWIGARNAKRYNDYCDLDDGYPWGSSASDLDHATNNVVMQNRVVKRSLSMFRVDSITDANNEIKHNETVTTWPARPAGCYTGLTYSQDFVDSGETVALVGGSTGSPFCVQGICADGKFSYGNQCEVRAVSFGCSAWGDADSDGCGGTASCGAKHRIAAAAAACNLEVNQAISDTVFSELGMPTINSVRDSDHIEDGSCQLGSTDLYTGSAVARGPASSSAAYSCSETDSNGGDCNMRGKLYCAVPSLTFSSNGPIAGLSCTAVTESRDAAGGWADNYLCATSDIGLRYSSAGPIAGMRCTQLREPAEPDSTTWDDNYICLPTDSPMRFTWSSAGPPSAPSGASGWACVHVKEPSDPHSWSDNWLCY